MCQQRGCWHAAESVDLIHCLLLHGVCVCVCVWERERERERERKGDCHHSRAGKMESDQAIWFTKFKIDLIWETSS